VLARVRSPLAIRDLVGATFDREVADQSSVETLEHAFAGHFEFPHGVLFRYGRGGLHALLSVLGWQDREILCPAYCCGEVPYAVTASGNDARFVDSGLEHFLPDVSGWQAAVTARSAAAIVAPLFGYPVDKDAERAVRAVSPGIFVIYDEAQSYGAMDEGGFQARDADAALFSLGLGKMITGLGGGIVLVRDAALHRELKSIRNRTHVRPTVVRTAYSVAAGVAAWFAFREPMVTLIDRFAATRALSKPDIRYRTSEDRPELPRDAGVRMPRYQARVGLRQFGRLGPILAARHALGSYYERRLREEGFRTFEHAHRPTWPRYPLAVQDRPGVIARSREYSVQLSDFLDYSSADLPFYRTQAAGSFPNASLWGRSMINLPIWHGMDEARAERVIAVLARLRDRGDGSSLWPRFPGRDRKQVERERLNVEPRPA
jgi:dTDP-4-amino-4,6-dideoxygalactose transaminase